MATQCTQESGRESGNEGLGFGACGRREVVAKFDGGAISSDGGGLLLREVDQRLQLLRRLAGCFTDHRNPDLIEHSVEQLLSQRVFGLALGYEDLNDHDELRQDPLFAVLCGKDDPEGQDRVHAQDRGRALAGKSTLNRLELTRPGADSSQRYKKIEAHGEAMDTLLIETFVTLHGRPSGRIWLDVDATDDPLHGQQEGRFFHGYYREYCYLPLYIFCGDHLLCARLREAREEDIEGTVAEIERIVAGLRRAWPEVRIGVRGDSGFCRDALMGWCEANEVDFVFGLARNARLKRHLAPFMEQATELYRATGKAARVFTEFTYRTRDSWRSERRVVGKAERLPGKENPRYVVTSLRPEEAPAASLYEQIYCARGEMENRIKEQQLALFADRTSSATMHANQLRLYFASFAYVLINALRHCALRGTEDARMQCDTIRLKLLKIGAQIRVTVRKVWISLSESCPYAALFRTALERLRAYPLTG